MNLTKFPLIRFQGVLTKLNKNCFEHGQRVIFSNNSLIFRKSNKNLGKFSEIILFGLNYNAKRIKHFKKPWVLDLQKSHKIKFSENRIGDIKTKIFKRRILFFSYDRQKLSNLLKFLKKNRKQNSYSGHGVILRTDKYLIKPGKIRQK